MSPGLNIGYSFSSVLITHKLPKVIEGVFPLANYISELVIASFTICSSIAKYL
jgi:hypothetical protein|nr:MAG TPA: hypothetical protein [Bacteriophage sp.]